MATATLGEAAMYTVGAQAFASALGVTSMTRGGAEASLLRLMVVTGTPMELALPWQMVHAMIGARALALPRFRGTSPSGKDVILVRVSLDRQLPFVVHVVPVRAAREDDEGAFLASRVVAAMQGEVEIDLSASLVDAAFHQRLAGREAGLQRTIRVPPSVAAALCAMGKVVEDFLAFLVPRLQGESAADTFAAYNITTRSAELDFYHALLHEYEDAGEEEEDHHDGDTAATVPSTKEAEEEGGGDINRVEEPSLSDLLSNSLGPDNQAAIGAMFASLFGGGGGGGGEQQGAAHNPFAALLSTALQSQASGGSSGEPEEPDPFHSAALSPPPPPPSPSSPISGVVPVPPPPTHDGDGDDDDDDLEP